ncbi:MAG: hypothetical protein IPN08_10695 [Bacteroidales bacterium]|nr:hypothetical protein [Bacteroidales bacterium]
MVAFINDKKTGELYTVSAEPTIHFTSAPGDDPNRFELIFGTVGADENASQFRSYLLFFRQNHHSEEYNANEW